MHVLLLVVALSFIVQAATVPHVFRRSSDDFTWAYSPSHVQQSLGPHLSKNASIYFPGSSGFASGTDRWSLYAQPNISVVVEVGNAKDVAAAIKYANSVNLPFLAVSGGHGSPYTLEKVHHGIEIWLSQLTSIEVAEDGNTAVLDGGVYVKEVIDELAEYKKVTASGACGCVGLMGAGLGGGHGRFQGYYGLVADNFVDLNVVLWNGTQVQASATSNPDLFWAMRGAGHNYGVVTSLTYKIYDEPSPIWFYAIYLFTQDKLESVFEELNRQADATLPREMGYIYVNFLWNTAISTTEPIVMLIINYAGNTEAAAPYANPFKALVPAAIEEGEVPYSQIANVSQTDVNDEVCAHGTQHLLFAADLLTYNISTNRAIYELFKNMTVAYPEFRTSIVLFESYSQQGVKAVEFDSTAFPNRESNIVFSIVIQYAPEPSLDEISLAWGTQTRSLAHAGEAAGSDLHVYVNYAFGGETLESLYGYEPWRLEKLRRLKKEWDPYNKFGYYLPIS